MTGKKEFAEEVADIAKDIVDKKLAGVGYYTEEGTGITYERGDVQEEYVRTDVEEILVKKEIVHSFRNNFTSSTSPRKAIVRAPSSYTPQISRKGNSRGGCNEL